MKLRSEKIAQCEEYIYKLHKKTKKLSMKNLFIATLTHEIRNFVAKYFFINYIYPFYSIIANTTDLRETKTWNETSINDLHQSATYIFDILNNTLDISKLEEGKIVFNKNYEPIHEFVEIVMSLVKSNASKKHINLESYMSPILPRFIEFDKSRVTQILLNLLNNAIKFTPQNGDIKIGVNWTYKCEHITGNCLDCDGCYIMKENESRPINKLKEHKTPGQSVSAPVFFDLRYYTYSRHR